MVQQKIFSVVDKGFFSQAAAAVLVLCGCLAMGPGMAEAVTPWYAAGSGHTLVLKKDGTVWALGSNTYGQLGNGMSNSQSDEPIKVEGLNGVVSVVAGGAHSAALKSDGTVWAWGYNGSGQLGNGSTKDSFVPVQVTGLKNITAIAAGKGHMVALAKDGMAWAWGSDRSGQLGTGAGSIASTPVRVSGLDTVVSVAAGAFHTMALKKDGTVWTWGFNGAGQLGNATTISSKFPEKVPGLTAIRAIAAGENHVVALDRDGTTLAWGGNHASQLGNGTNDSGSRVPVHIAGVAGIRDITAMANHTIALKTDGTVWAWGDYGSGQWGNGYSMNGSALPVQKRGASSFTTVAAVGNPDTVLHHDGAFLANAEDLTPGTIVARSESLKITLASNEQ